MNIIKLDTNLMAGAEAIMEEMGNDPDAIAFELAWRRHEMKATRAVKQKIDVGWLTRLVGLLARAWNRMYKASLGWRPISTVPKDGRAVLLCWAFDADGRRIAWEEEPDAGATKGKAKTRPNLSQLLSGAGKAHERAYEVVTDHNKENKQ